MQRWSIALEVRLSDKCVDDVARSISSAAKDIENVNVLARVGTRNLAGEQKQTVESVSILDYVIVLVNLRVC